MRHAPPPKVLAREMLTAASQISVETRFGDGSLGSLSRSARPSGAQRLRGDEDAAQIRVADPQKVKPGQQVFHIGVA